MIFTETKLKGAYIVRTEPVADERGFFARCFCCDEFSEYGIPFRVKQCNISYNRKAGTVHGMHYQVAPHEETKLVRCVQGLVYDAIIDMRPESTTYRQWFGLKLSARSSRMLYVPKGFAHGYMSLTDNAMVYYLVSEKYHPECERTICWNDPAIGIAWPEMSGYTLSEKDARAAYI